MWFVFCRVIFFSITMFVRGQRIVIVNHWCFFFGGHFSFTQKMGRNIEICFFWRQYSFPVLIIECTGEEIKLLFFWRTFFSLLPISTCKCSGEPLFSFFFGRKIPSPVQLFPSCECSGEYLFIFYFIFLETIPSPVLLIPTCKCLGEYLFIFVFFGETIPSPVLLIPTQNSLGEYLFMFFFFFFFFGDNSLSSTTNPHAKLFGRVPVHVCLCLGEYSYSRTTNPYIHVPNLRSGDILWNKSWWEKGVLSRHKLIRLGYHAKKIGRDDKSNK